MSDEISLENNNNNTDSQQVNDGSNGIDAQTSSSSAVDPTIQMKQSYENLSLDQSIEKLFVDGSKHLSDVHGFKSVIGELQQVKGGAEDNKKELQRMAYAKNLQLLEPNIQIMRSMSLYSEILCQKVVEYVASVVKSEPTNAVPSRAQMETLIKVLDNVLILDYLKTWQAGLNNDFSMYRRAMQHVRKDYSLTDDETLRHFLISAHNINKGLKKDLQDKVDGFEKVFIHVIKHCVDLFAKEPQQHQLMRVSVFCVFLIDTTLANNEKVAFAKKHLKFSKLSKLFDDHPRVLMYSTDLFMNVPYYLKGSPNFVQCAEDDSGFSCFSR